MSEIVITESRLKQIIREEISSLIKENIKTKNVSIDAPSAQKPIENSLKVFLAGTIDCDKGSVDWQHEICRKITQATDNKQSITIFNPRREEFPDSGSAEVRRQIKWEHEHMDDADLIVMNILEDSQSPISLMEIGMYAQSEKLHVFCKKGFYRYDNVEMVCKKYNIPLHNINDNDTICKFILTYTK